MTKFQNYYNQLEEGVNIDLSQSKLLGISNDLKTISNEIILISTKLNPTQKQYLRQFSTYCLKTANFLINIAKVL
jgi:hypothetical protein